MRTKLIDVDNRLSIKFNKTEGLFNWGEDNAYPSLVKSIIGSSTTARRCTELNAKYLYGKGFAFVDSITDKSSIIVNSFKHININQLYRAVTREYAEQNNAFLIVNYNSLYEIISVDVIHCTDVRVGKQDSLKYSGKFVNYPNFDRSISKAVNKDEFILIDRFNPSPEVIQAQVDSSGGWNKYRGQILHIKNDFGAIYSLSDIDSALLDADSEYQATYNKNRNLRKGFSGLKLIVTKPFADDERRDEFDRTVQDLRGSENSSGILLLEAEGATDVLSEQIFIQNIESNTDDSATAHTEESAARAIKKAFGVPSILIDSSDNSVFANSGELLKQSKLEHWENLEEERSVLIDVFQTIFSRWHSPIIKEVKDWSIKPIIAINTTESE